MNGNTLEAGMARVAGYQAEGGASSSYARVELSKWLAGMIIDTVMDRDHADRAIDRQRTVAPDDEVQLLARIREGDGEAFTAVYRRHQAAIYRFALHMSGSAATAEDVTQEVFLLLMRDAYRFDASKGTLAAFLFGVARHHVWRYLGRGGRELPIDAANDGRPVTGGRPDRVTDPLAAAARIETIEAVRRAVRQLPAHQREVIVLCDLQELDYAEAASAIGCPIGTVRSRLSRARARLATILRQTGAIDADVKALKPARYAT
jgi:RNA polymerase sigma-70 factor (ECF subfamily)